MAKNRNYNYRDVDMVLASKTIAGSFKANLTELSTVRTNWTPAYATELEGRIDEAIDRHLGMDAKKELRAATNKLTTLMGPAKRDLSTFKTQVEDDFKNDTARRKEILKALGFAKNLRAVQKDDQEALIELLYTFRQNMTDKMKQKITANGMHPVLIDNITGYADAVKTANVRQESLKLTTQEITREVAGVLMAIYDEIIGICKIASVFYQDDPVKKEQFTFSKVVSNLHAAKKATSQE